jgi:hypothetical protein
MMMKTFDVGLLALSCSNWCCCSFEMVVVFGKCWLKIGCRRVRTVEGVVVVGGFWVL